MLLNYANCGVAAFEQQPAKVAKKRGPKKKQMTPERVQKLKQRRVRANHRERNRMHGLNYALENLRKYVPCCGASAQKLSKIETLKLARNYIATLTEMLQLARPLDLVTYARKLTSGLTQNTVNLVANSMQLNPRLLMTSHSHSQHTSSNSNSNSNSIPLLTLQQYEYTPTQTQSQASYSPELKPSTIAGSQWSPSRDSCSDSQRMAPQFDVSGSMQVVVPSECAYYRPASCSVQSTVSNFTSTNESSADLSDLDMAAFELSQIPASNYNFASFECF